MATESVLARSGGIIYIYIGAIRRNYIYILARSGEILSGNKVQKLQKVGSGFRLSETL